MNGSGKFQVKKARLTHRSNMQKIEAGIAAKGMKNPDARHLLSHPQTKGAYYEKKTPASWYDDGQIGRASCRERV